MTSNSHTQNVEPFPNTDDTYVIYIREESGTLTIVPEESSDHQTKLSDHVRRDERLPQTIKSAARQSRARLRNHAVSRSLGVCMTVTYKEITDDPIGDVTAFIEDIRGFYPPPLHWIIVTEGVEEGSEHRPHHHVLLPFTSDLHKVASQWPHGDIHVGINPNDESIRRVANYVSKEFERPTGDQPRFRASRGGRPKQRVIHASSLDEAINIANSQLPEGIDAYTSNYPGINGRITYYWERTPQEGMWES